MMWLIQCGNKIQNSDKLLFIGTKSAMCVESAVTQTVIIVCCTDEH